MKELAITFYNPTDEVFDGYWDGEKYRIPAKGKIQIARYIAKHFAKHLANKILQERFNKLCDEHEVTTTPLTRTCAKCKTKTQKLEALYTCPERTELLKEMLIEQSEETVNEEVPQN